MHCLKCGREILTDGVFCQGCLLDMKKYPVKPGTVVILPPKQSASRRQAAKRRAPTPEEQVKTLKSRIRKLMIALLVAAVLIASLAAFCIAHLTEGTHYRPGQNYHTVTETTEASENSFSDFLDTLIS